MISLISYLISGMNRLDYGPVVLSKLLVCAIIFQFQMEKVVLQMRGNCILRVQKSKNFPGLRPVPRWGGLQRPPQTPQLSLTRSARFARYARLPRCARLTRFARFARFARMKPVKKYGQVF